MIEKKKLPIGEEFFRNIRTKGFYYVDKTGFISELLRYYDPDSIGKDWMYYGSKVCAGGCV